jgi:tRNA nucleotidyltransferase (CCA-adding enzyme)
MTLDAKRRDFTANAVYYDIAADRFVDPLGGIDDIKNKTLRTVDDSDKVFGEDGLRLMRLARQAGQLGFSPNAECLSGAKKNASLIRDISPERIWAELVSLLHADKKYGIADGHYRGLKLLDETGVLDVILPELALGRGMAQRADFHNYDVLEHTFHAVLYADERVRLSALLHDVAKPFCVKRDGNSFAHPTEGARMADEILTRFKAPKHTTATVKELVLYHMYDFDGQTKENKLRRFFVVHRPVLEELLLLKQADFSGCKDDLSPCPTGIKWRKLLDKMRVEGAPTSLKELAITGKEVAEADDMQPKYIADVLRELLLHAALEPQDNTKERLLAFIPSALHEVLAREAKERKL